MAELAFEDGVVSYDVHGDGPPLVLLRGLARSVSHWLGYEKVLARDYRVITIDLRGVGKTTRPWGLKTSIYDMAGDVVAVLDELNIEKATVMGVSLGGMVALAVGLTYPKRCRSLITLNTSIAGMRTLRLTPGGVKTILSSIYLSPEKLQAALVDVLVGDECTESRRAEIAAAYHDIAKAETMYAYTAIRQLLAAGRFMAARKLKSMDVPTLIVYGTDDRFVPTVNSRKLAQYISKSTVVPIHGGGHELPLDKPDELTTVVKRWMSELR